MTKAGSRLINSARQAAAIARGDAEAARLYVPAEIDVKAIRTRIGLSQDDFASQFGFSVNQIRDWEQTRSRPLGGVRAYLMMIDARPDIVRQLLSELRKEALASAPHAAQHQLARAM
jgi:putative transcriptional regulator